MDTAHLVRPARYQRENRHLFRTYAALRWHLDRRHINGMLACGACIESPLGLLLNEEKMPAWLMGAGQEEAATHETSRAAQ